MPDKTRRTRRRPGKKDRLVVVDKILELTERLAKAEGKLVRITQILWPREDPERAWSPETLDLLARVMEEYRPDTPDAA